MKKSRILLLLGIGIMVFGFGFYGFSNTIDCVFYDSPVTLTPLHQSLCDLANFGIKLFPIGLSGLVISIIGLVVHRKGK